jgi:HEAT repeat protein
VRPYFKPGIGVLVTLLITASLLAADAVTPVSVKEMESRCSVAGELLKRGRKAEALKIYQELDTDSAPEPIQIAVVRGLTAIQGAEALPRLLRAINSPNERIQVTAGRCAETIPGKEVTAQLVAAAENAAAYPRETLLDTVARRGDVSAVPLLAKYLRSSDRDLCRATLWSLRNFPDRSTIELLAMFASKNVDKAAEKERTTARESLKQMTGSDKTDELILGMMSGAEPRVRAELIRAAAVRQIKAAIPILLESINDPDETIRIPIVYNLGKMGTAKDLPRLIEVIPTAKGDEPRRLGVEALVEVSTSLGDRDARAAPFIKALASARPALAVVLLQVLGRIQGAAAVTAVREAARATRDEVRWAAGDVLSHWRPACDRWLFSGPYQQEGRIGPKAHFDIAFEPETDPAKAKWAPLKVTDPKNTATFELTAIWRGFKNGCGYARTTVISDKEQQVLMTVGSDDGVKVWLNGEMVHAKDADRMFTPDEDKVKVTLRRGENPLMLKIMQGGADWVFRCGLRAEDGGPVPGVSYEAR